MHEWPNLLTSLLQLAENNQGMGSILAAEELARWPKEVVAAFKESGLLRPAPPAENILCSGCEKACTMPVEYLGEDDVLKPLPYVACPDNGLIEIESDLLRCWQVTLSTIAAFLAGQLGLNPHPEKLLDSALWVLGSYDIGGTRYELYLASFATQNTAQRVSERLAMLGSPAPAILFPAASPPAELAERKCIHLAYVLTLEVNSVSLDHHRLAALIDPASADRFQPDFLFRRNRVGTWEFRFAGRGYPAMKENRGFRYIQHLLQNTGKPISAIKLSALPMDTKTHHQEPSTVGQFLNEKLNVSELGDAGMVLDATARHQYQDRLAELQDQLEDAQELNDVDRAAEIEEEREIIAKELSRATGLRGRDVAVASTQKRAQQAVSLAINRAIEALEKPCPELGAHLKETIATGSHPIYQPTQSIDWRY
jgi:hypothetical protein